METQVSEIAKLNDEFRCSGSVIYTLTLGVLSNFDMARVAGAVRSFDTFTEDNDPHGEHDFGGLELEGEKLFWKIDYYTKGLRGWCDPLSPDCCRVLTVMLASEY